jgi:hypothetical protein
MPNRDGATLLLHAEAGKAKTGNQGNLIVDVFLDRPLENKPGKPRINQRRQPVGTLPAIPFEIVGQARSP